MIDEFEFPTEESRMIALQLGIVCIKWSGIDSMIGVTLGMYLGFEAKHANLPVDIMKLSQKCSMLKSVIFMKESKEYYNKVEYGLNFIDSEIRIKRNRYIHDEYRFFTGENTRIFHRSKIKNIQSFQKELISKVESGVTSKEIIEFNLDLDACSMFAVSLAFKRIFRNVKDEKTRIALKTTIDKYHNSLISVINRYR